MFAFLLTASLAATAPAQNAPLIFAPPEDTGRPYPCDIRPCLRPQPKPATAYEGRFSIHREAQIQCRQAPCPQADTIVSLPDGKTIRVSRVSYAQGTAQALKLKITPAPSKILFSGKLWITLRDQIAIVAPESAAYAPSAANSLSPRASH